MVDKRGIFRGGEGGIRTLERLLTVTRFPIVRARPGYATSPHRSAQELRAIKLRRMNQALLL